MLLRQLKLLISPHLEQVIASVFILSVYTCNYIEQYLYEEKNCRQKTRIVYLGRCSHNSFQTTIISYHRGSQLHVVEHTTKVYSRSPGPPFLHCILVIHSISSIILF